LFRYLPYQFDSVPTQQAGGDTLPMQVVDEFERTGLDFVFEQKSSDYSLLIG
jgi:hypothetical protein